MLPILQSIWTVLTLSRVTRVPYVRSNFTWELMDYLVSRISVEWSGSEMILYAMISAGGDFETGPFVIALSSVYVAKHQSHRHRPFSPGTWPLFNGYYSLWAYFLSSLTCTIINRGKLSAHCLIHCFLNWRQLRFVTTCQLYLFLPCRWSMSRLKYSICCLI